MRGSAGSRCGEGDLAGAAQHSSARWRSIRRISDVLADSARLLAALGRLDEALALYESVVARDPVNAAELHHTWARRTRYAGRYDEAIASSPHRAEPEPERGAAHYQLGVALLLKGERRRRRSRRSSRRRATAGAGSACRWPTTRSAARPIRRRARRADREDEKESAYNIAYVYAFRGEADQAFEWLDKAVEYRDPGLAEIVVENLFDNLHADPRWLPFLRKIGKAPEQLAKIQFKVTLPK